MTHEEKLETLRGVSELADYGLEQLRSVVAYFDEVCVPTGTTLAEQGRLCHEFVVVASGEIESLASGRKTLHGPGCAFGWKAMRERAAHDATVSAIGPAHLLVMGHSQFRAAAGLR